MVMRRVLKGALRQSRKMDSSKMSFEKEYGEGCKVSTSSKTLAICINTRVESLLGSAKGNWTTVPVRKAGEYSKGVLSGGSRDTNWCHPWRGSALSSSDEWRGLDVAEFLVRLDGEIFRPELLAIPLEEIDIVNINGLY
jgi:hypothetical protein